MIADETHRMEQETIAGLKIQADDRLPSNVVVISTANGCEVVHVSNVDPVALAIERRKLERQKGDAKRMRRERGE